MRSSGVILIADDEPLSRKTIHSLLLNQGYTLLLAADGLETLDLARQHKPDLILLDVMMPGLNGFDVCRRLRESQELAEVPIILLTALDDRESRLFGLESGADDFISKPFDRAELRARVQTIIRLNRYRRLLQERARFDRAVELSPNGTLFVDAQANILMANPVMLALLNRPRDQKLIGQRLFTLLAPNQIATCAALLRTVISNPSITQRLETLLLRASGELLPVEIDMGYLEWNDAPGVQVIIRDITERRRRERALEVFVQVATALRAASNRNAMLPLILDQLERLLFADAAALVQFNQDATPLIELGIGVWASPQSSAPMSAELRQLLMQGYDQPRRHNDTAGGILRGLATAPLIAQGRIFGALWVGRRLPIGEDELQLLAAVADISANAIHRSTLNERIQRSAIEIASAYDSTLEGWARFLDLRDRETEGHSRRVTELSLKLANRLGLPPEELVHLRRGALLHDIGKMGIPDAILHKASTLSDEEWTIMRKHPVYAYEMLEPIDYLRPALDVPYCHHEKWDGTGYPRGLAGEEIPLFARIFAVVDVWDALRSDRPYRPAWSVERTLQYIREQSGKHFDPRVVAAFLLLNQQESVPPELNLL